MDKINILSEIKKLMTFGEEKINFRDAKVGDLIIRVDADDFAEGLVVTVVTEDGVIPASPDMAGEHDLGDGRAIVIDETGLITEIKEVPVLEEDEVILEEDKKEDFEEVIEEVVEEIENKEDFVEEKEEEMKEEDKKDEKYEALELRIKEMEDKIKEMIELNKQTEDFSKVVIEKLDGFIKDTPAELEFKSIKTEYTNDFKNKRMTNLEVINNLRKK